MGKCLNEVFLSTVDLDFDRRQKTPGVFLSEVFTHTQRVMNEAKKRGHKVGTAVSLETGYDLRRPLVQKAVLRVGRDSGALLPGHCLPMWSLSVLYNT